MLLRYLRDDYHKQAVTHIRESRRFESMYTLQGETRPTHHTLFMFNPRMVQDHTYLMWSTYSNPS
jgi:predicted GTPase